MCELGARSGQGVFLWPKAGQLVSRGSRTSLIRVSLGRDPETGPGKSIHGSLREAQAYLNGKLRERGIGRLPRAAAISRSQENLSADCGFDRTYISRVERGIINPTISRLWRIADALNAPLSQIVKAMEGWAAGVRAE